MIEDYTETQKRTVIMDALALAINSIDRKLSSTTNPLFIEIYETDRSLIKAFRHHISTAAFQWPAIDKETRKKGA